MNQKLNYLEMLKHNMGGEQAEMMSDEITKVMDEQRSIELEYGRLVEQRDQLKGITNKRQLEETKQEIVVSKLNISSIYTASDASFSEVSVTILFIIIQIADHFSFCV